MADFLPGLTLAAMFHDQVVAPILRERFPGLPYSAGRLDFGSDVLGFDTPRSCDHGWGPFFTIYLRDDDAARHGSNIVSVLGDTLPFEFHGHTTAFVDADWKLSHDRRRPVPHKVTVTSIGDFFRRQLGVDPRREPSAADWLMMPQQRLRAVRSGRVFHDGLAELEPTRRRVAWYPHDLWLHLMACQWRRVEQEEPFVGRTGEVGDELGSRILAARLVQELMRLCFLIEREYRPYAKWFGTAFARLRCATELLPILQAATAAQDWRERETHLASAYLAVQRMHNALGVTEPLDVRVAPFHARPFLVSHAERFVQALRAAVTAEAVRNLPPHLGSVDQVLDSTDVLDDVDALRRVRPLYARRPALR